MKKKMYPELTDLKEVHDNLEANCVGVEENYSFVKPFSAEELREEESLLSKNSVRKNRLEVKIKSTVEPLKEELKPINSDIKTSIKNLDQGGIDTYGNVFCFEDFESGLMGLYNDEGTLVGTRPLTRQERQLHINSNFKKASNE